MIYKYTYPPSIMPEDTVSGQGWWTPTDEATRCRHPAHRKERGSGYEGHKDGNGGYRDGGGYTFDWGWAD